MRVAPATPEALAEAVAILRRGGLVAMPTETVYGLAADAASDRAVARIFAAKGRPRFNPLIAHAADVAAARALVDMPPAAQTLAGAFWPGPLTLVAPKKPDACVSLLATAGLDTLAVRVPAHPVAQALLRAFGGALVAPSANRSGRLSPTSAEDVAGELGGEVDLVLDGGRCAIGLESTIVGFFGARPALLRPGGVPRADIEARVGALATAGAEDETAPVSPGRLASHYAPRAPVRLGATAPAPGEAYLAFGRHTAPGALNLSPSGDLVEAAANLFAFLRRLDASGPSAIAIAPIPNAGLGEAINDRLARAAAPR